MNPSRIDTFPSPNEEYYRDNDISEIGVFVAKEMASDAMDEECYYEAIEYFQKVIELSNEEYSFDKADANNGIGICYFKLNNFIEAEKYFLKNKQLLPAFPFTYENLVATYYNLEEFNQLFEICENLPSNIEVTPTIWYYVGLANEKIGDLEISRTAFQKALLGGMDNCFEDLNRVLIKISNNNE
jgi:tetratricopeptide (TPR) repeat protein